MSAVPATAESSEYVRVKRKRQTIFLYANMPIDTVHDLRARANLVTKVPTSEMRFYLDESGEVLLDENKTLKEQKIENDMVLYMVYRIQGSDDWETVMIGDKKAEGEA
ncbi:transcription elongation factor b polypeptide 2-like protein [Chrysochromulina tobinii]|uniref:Transcription elongation factor b polypeptide 2-like protein n=1 Tax=Chrysochromulina tobinii TaxID=1460289 RepID=A0A0M0JP22_9EUKA|nr:transcription elongation factor b polypeptide 2-like protein [Chrysochromulina tobinii]|eukprot:KOO27983.1 transcription elongation factor b polypeptide 2-like protein [Chrysochromulina sp. CCMP291]